MPKKEPEKKELKWRVSIILLNGDDVILAFDNEGAAMKAVTSICENGYVTQDRRADHSNYSLSIHPFSQIKRLDVYEVA